MKQKLIIPSACAGNVLHYFATVIFIIISLVAFESKVLAEGSPQFRPDTTKTTYLMILNTQPTYGTFAGYSATDDNRLYIRINNPSTEVIYFGVGQRTSTSNWYYRIKNPNGTVIYGPALLPTSGTGFINYHRQAIAGPNTFSPSGYSPIVINPTAGLAGNYYIEFNQGSGNTVSNNKELGLGIFDITVGKPSTSTIAEGRLFSKNWSFNTDSYANQFYGSFFIYGSDSSVTKIALNGIKPYKFRVSCNSYGALNTANASLNRQSQLGFHVPPELLLFLRDPDSLAFPSGSLHFLSGPVTLTGCKKDSLCINVNLVKKSDVTIVIDRNNNNVYDPGTTDRKLFFPGTNAGINCLFWDGKDGLGNYIPVAGNVKMLISVESGEVNLPIFDVESHPMGYTMSVIRPPGALFVDSLFYDDVLVGGSTSLNGCAFPCHTWNSNPANTESNTIGNDNTINSWWFAKKQSQTVNLTMPDFLQTNAGVDQDFCLKVTGQDSIQLSGSIAFSLSGFSGSKKWTTSGTGVFIPNDSTFTPKYLPSAADVAAGFVKIYLAPRYYCDEVKDSVLINLRKSPSLSSAPVHINCFGQATGSLTVTPSNSTSPYSYLWNTGNASSTLSMVSAGTYTVTVTSANGCSSVASYTLNQPAASLTGNINAITHVNCFGQATGSVSFSAMGGTSPYTYSWNNGASSQSLTNIPAGVYTVTVTDFNGCTSVNSSVQVNGPAAPLTSSIGSITSVSCNGGNDGTIALNISGGTSPYSFLWSTGATSQNLNNLAAGSYTVTVTDSKGCTSTRNISISQPGAVLSSSATITQQVNCFGGSNGSINVTVAGGTAPYTYLWNNGQTTNNLNSLSSGTYTVTITDAHNCTAMQNATVIQPSAALHPTLTTAQNINCFNNSTGSINISVNGGTAPYTYLWSNGQVSQDITGLSSGQYAVTVTDANNCTANLTTTLTQPSAELNAVAVRNSHVSCFGGNNGSINLNVSGGTSPYVFLWSNGSASQNISGLVAGNYSVTITDANGCTATQAMSISQPSAALNGVTATLQQVSCFGGSNGQVSLSVTGGTNPYSYNWSNGAVTPNISNLSQGTYTVTVTDGNGCTLIRNATVSQPAMALSGSTSTTSNISCFSGNNGAIDLTVSGGTAPYSYNWSTGATSQDLSGLPAGNYSVTITDANGCLASSNGIISQPAGALSANINISQTIPCFGGGNGAINLSVSGGTAPYVYQWNNGQTTEDISSLAAGSYTVTITDANGCNTTANANITQPAAPLAASVSTIVPALCFGDNTGGIDISVNGGTFPYSYNWSNGQTTQDLLNLTSGNYTVTITDQNGCTTIQTANVTQPSAVLSSTITPVAHVLCYGGNNGSINLSVSGGTSPYSYEWSNGQTTEDINNVAAGVYTVTITDSNGCLDEQQTVITQPSAALNASASSTQAVGCFGGNNGSATVTVNGGTAPYTYQWSNGQATANSGNLSQGVYTVTVTDQNGCTDISTVSISQPAAALNANANPTQSVSCFGGTNGTVGLSVTGGTAPYSYLWSNGVTLQNLTGVQAGTYTVTVSDQNGCTTISTASVSQPSAGLNGIANAASNVSCFGGNNGNIILNVSGGTTPYTYLWNTGSSNQNLIGVSSGTYTVEITDANGCTANANATISQPSAPLSSTLNVIQPVLCFGGSTGMVGNTVNGGTLPYTYSWNNGATSQNLNNISAGLYTVTVTDANGCMSIQSVNISQPAATLSGTALVTQHASCFGSTNGSGSVSASGGTAPYTYLWSNGNSTSTINNIAAGTYTVTVTDANGCTVIRNITVNQPSAALNTTVSASQQVNCFGGSDGSLSLNVSGGTGPFTFLWNNGATSQNVNSLVAGTYSVTVTDANGCTNFLNAVISQPSAALTAGTQSFQSVNCFGGNNGTILLVVNGGTSPYSYTWSNGAVTPFISGLASGNYSVTVTDANGCSEQHTQYVGQPEESLNANPVVDQEVLCFGNNTASASVLVTGGTIPYSYSWSNGANTQHISSLYSGTYTVTVSDNNGCTSQESITVTQPAAAVSGSMSVSQNVSCNSGNNGVLNVTPSGGTAPYTYVWSNGQSTQSASSLPAGTYTVTITDSNGCSDTQSGTITQPVAALTASTSVTSNISCFSGNNGAIDLTVNGGTAPYSYVWNTGSVTQDVSGLGAGIYSVTITDANNCTATSTAQVVQPAGSLSASIVPQQHVSCYGGNNGSLNLTVSGGTAPYSYVWNTGSTSANLTNLITGIYTVTITDNNGCNTMQSALVSQPSAALSIQANTIQPVLCYGGNDGSVDIVVSGGTAPYQYLWNTGDITEDLSGVSSGMYTVTITDANGCVVNLSETVNQPAASLNAVANTTADVLCFAGNNGSIDLNVTGGTQPYSFVWNNGETTEDISQLISGNYSVTITDANGCTEMSSAIVSQPAAPMYTSLSILQPANCFGENGTADITVTGGTIPYNYLWSNGDSAQDLTAGAGNYQVMVTDANGCMDSLSVTITQPAGALSIVLNNAINILCNGGNNGSIDVTASAGTSPYTYLWNTGSTDEDLVDLSDGTYTVTVTDFNGCTNVISSTLSEPLAALANSIVITQNINCFANEEGSLDLTVTGGTSPYTFLWSNGSVNEDQSLLFAGTYTVTITDNNGCTSEGQATLTEPLAPLMGNISVVSNVSCNGDSTGSLDLTITGGTTPYATQWNNGASSEDLTNLAFGVYTVTVTDANGCTFNTSASVGQPSQQLNAGTPIVQHVLCFNGNNGFIDISVSGGTAPYTFVWSNGMSTEDIGGLVAGVYTVTITDANNCTASVNASVTQPGAPLIPVLTIGQNVSCFGGNNGFLDLSVTGGTPPYSYLWSNGSVSEDLSGVPAGTYTVIVTDENGCNAIITEIIAQPANALIASVTVDQDVLCHGGSNGIITASAMGGTAPYSYTWNTGSTAATLQNLLPGTYTVTVTDNQGCTFTASASVSQPAAALGVNGTTTIANCLSGLGGSVTINVTGGTQPYSYAWSNGHTTQNLQDVAPGSYNVIITDANGCTLAASYIVGNDSDFNLTEAGPKIICAGEMATLIADTIAGGSYQWYYSGVPLNGATTNIFITPAAGFYSVSVTIPCGTFFTDSIEVIVKSVENASISSNQIICPPEFVQLHASGGVSYQWTPANFISNTNVSDPIVAPATTTTYQVEITNEFGCKTVVGVEVAVACDSIFIPNGFSPNDDGVNDGYVIDGIENYPGNKLWVYNRWGNLVYKTKDYKNDWDGISNVSGIYIGKKVPSGTYYFILDLNDGSKPKAGYLIIRRG